MSNVDTTASKNNIPLTFVNFDAMSDYLEGFREKYKRNPSLTIEEANSVIMSASRDKEMTVEDWTQLFEEAEQDEEAEEKKIEASALVPQVVKDAISIAKKHPVALRAENLASKAAHDGTFTAFLNALGDKKLEVERGPLDTNFHLRRIYTAEELKAFPIVGSKGGNNADLYQGKYFKANGDEATKEMSFYTAFAATLPSYIDTDADLENAKLAETDSRAANVPAHYKGKSKWHMKARVKTLKSRLSNIKALVVRAFVIEQNIARINEDLGKTCKAIFVTHTNGQGTQEAAPGISEPFVVGDNSNGEVSFMASAQTLNITRFTSLDIDEALKNGGTFDALMDTIKRETKKTKVAFAVNSFDTLQIAFALSKGFIETLKTPDQRAMLKAKIVSDKEGYLETVFDLKETLVSVCSDQDLQKAYARHMQAKLNREAYGETETKTGTNG